MQRSAITTTPAIPTVVRGTNGRLPFIVQAAAQTAARADQLAAAIPADLAPEQSDGLACVLCGRMDTTMRPAGTCDGVQVFACSPSCPADDTVLTDVLAVAVPTALAATIPGIDADTAAAIAADITNRLADTEAPTVTPYGPEDVAFDAALDAIKATFTATATGDIEETRLALRTAVDMYAEDARQL
ncbi:hypothetical protein OH738_18165 [Streptomyces hirsutus]|uniref:hypothetical protein n=1 Tax=Streptomyces hirsutus TaxID=35620 RepID=UPI003865AE5F|nr:hypothetical protein OH738_18165 [Streptomyces hirsutus]